MTLDTGTFGTSSSICGDSNGTMPSCAPLAVPYVPFQQKGSQTYSQTEALANGTLFPGLNLPFHVKVKAASIADTAVAELQALDFVLTELGIYLDTHSDDTEAFALFQQYEKLAREGRQRYEAMYGPITQASTAQDATYTWLNDPWPWEYNGKNGGNQ
jgi:spore coat protein JB